VKRELARTIGIQSEPRFVRIYKWPKAMAQYEVGHRDRVERIRGLVAGMPGLAVAGNYRGGIGVPDCVRAGSEAATKVLTELKILTGDKAAERG